VQLQMREMRGSRKPRKEMSYKRRPKDAKIPMLPDNSVTMIDDEEQFERARCG
jgi:hypothetical protein